MKTILKFTLIFVIVLSGTWIIFDDLIVKSIIIQETEKLTNKKVTLEDVNLYYFPNLKVELINLKIPNPENDNFIIKSKKIVIDIDLNQLLKKKLIINEINSDSSKFFDSTEKTEPIKKEKKEKKTTTELNEKNNIINSIISLPTDIFQNSEIITNLSENLNFTPYYDEIDQIINKSSLIFNLKKDKVMNLSNTTLYEINSINVENFNEIDDISFAKEKLKSISGSLDEIKTNSEEIKLVYKESINKIDNINASINRKVDSSFSFSVNKNILEENKIANNKISNYIKKYIGKVINKTFKKETQKTSDKNQGITYNFTNEKYPKFLIKKIEINKPINNDYLKAINISTNPKFLKKTKVYFKQTNKKKYEKFIVLINATTNNNFMVDFKINNLKVPTYKVVENNNFEFNFNKNKQTNIFINGTIGKAFDLNSNIIIKNPTYKLINKSPNSSAINDLIPFINNKDVDIKLIIKGELNDLKVTANSNVSKIINKAKDEILSSKIKRFNRKKRIQIRKIKTENNQKVKNKITNFNTEFEQIEYSTNFQIIEIENKLEQNRIKIYNKEQEIKNKIKESINSKINKIKS